jgi:hypothetical protein
MAKILDLRNSGGTLVIIGDAIAVPTSSLSLEASTAPNVAGSLRYNPVQDRIEYLSKNSEAWQSVFVGLGEGDLSGYVHKDGDTMTGMLVISGTGRIRTPDGTGSNPAYGFSTATTTGFALLGGAVTTLIGTTPRLSVGAASVTLGAKAIIPDGTVSEPGVSFASSVSSGMYYTTSTLNFAVNGTRRAQVTATGVTAALFTGEATSARYADLAERYHADAPYEPGTVLIIGGPNEVTISTSANDPRVAGIVSTQPGFMMNREAGDDATHPYIALKGRVPCRVVGEVRKGDMMVTSNVPGCAQARSFPSEGQVIGKALEDFFGEQGVIEVKV